MIFRLNYQVTDKLDRINSALKELYEKRDAYVKTLHERHGPNSILVKKNKDGTWEKITLRDDLKKISEGNPIFRSAKFSRFEINRRTLVNRPKEADEVYR
jgi:hypothetical protein